MSNIKRYRINHHGKLVEACACGSLVEFTDYIKLRQERDCFQSENKRLKEAMEKAIVLIKKVVPDNTAEYLCEDLQKAIEVKDD